MNALQAGIVAAREGRRAEARALLKEALQANPMSEQGWLWMSAAVDSDAERRVCLERVLSINPQNQTARAELEKLGSSSGPAGRRESYLPDAQPALAKQPQPGTGLQGAAGQAARSSSPHSMPTLGMESVPSNPRPIRRLVPQSDAWDELAQLRAARYEPSPLATASSSEKGDPFMALVLIGGLSITAVAGALMLVVLLLIGWPP